jgi:hypothetical protein
VQIKQIQKLWRKIAHDECAGWEEEIDIPSEESECTQLF